MLENNGPKETLGDLLTMDLVPGGCQNLCLGRNAPTLILIAVSATVSVQEMCPVDGKMAALSDGIQTPRLQRYSQFSKLACSFSS